MKFQEYLTSRKDKIEEIITTGTPYMVSQYTNASAVYGDEIFVAYDEIPNERLRQFIGGVLTHMGGIGQCMCLNKDLHRQYVSILFEIAEDLYLRAKEGTLECRLWFKQFAGERGLISEMQGHILRSTVTDEKLMYWDVFTRYFFGWYSGWED